MWVYLIARTRRGFSNKFLFPLYLQIHRGVIRIEILFLRIFVADVRIFNFLPKTLPSMRTQGHAPYLFFQWGRDLEGLGSPGLH